jgi:hypothetical protein
MKLKSREARAQGDCRINEKKNLTEEKTCVFKEISSMLILIQVVGAKFNKKLPTF